MDANKQLFWLSGSNRVDAKNMNNGMVQENAAPLALPLSIGPGENATSISKVSTINVIKNFNWTNSDRSRRELAIEDAASILGTQTQTPLVATAGIPAIILNEYRVTFSSALANMRYLINTLTSDSAKQLVESGTNLVAEGLIGDSALGKTVTKGINDAAASGIEFMSDIRKAGEKTVFGSKHSKYDPSGTAGLQNNPHLEPYAGLYLGAPSGFRYVFPYLTSTQYKTATNTWSEQGHQALQSFVGTLAGGIEAAGSAVGGIAGGLGGLLANSKNKYARLAGGLAEGAGAVAEGVGGGIAGVMTLPLNAVGTASEIAQQAAGALTPGSSLEETMTYTGYGAGNQAITVKFYLSNTHDFEEVIKNWHLIYLLQYQNQPNKNNRMTLEPPHMYEVTIPGHYYSPFAYITNLNVTAIGNTRIMRIPLQMDRISSTYSGGAPENNQFSFGDSPVPGVTGRGKHGSSSYNENDFRGITQTTLEQMGGSSLPDFVTVPIPEAYVVEMAITSMVPDSRNLTFHALRNDSTLYTATLKKQNTNNNPKMPPADAAEKRIQLNAP